MSDPRPGQRFAFDEPPTPADDTSLHGAQVYLPTQASDPYTAADDQESPALDAAVKPPRKRRWGLMAIVGATLGLGTIEAVQSLYTSALGGDWLSGAWSMVALLAVGLGAKALCGELWRLRKLRRHARLRQQLDDEWVDDTTDAHKDPAALADELRSQMGLSKDHPHWQSFLHAHEAHHTAQETRELIAYHILNPRDQAARRLVTRMSSETAVMVAVSPLTLVDMLLMAWRNIAMLDRIAALYGLQLGYASRLRLFREVLRNMAFAGASEMISDAGMDLLSMNLAAKLSTRAGQGLGAGLLTARLGLRAMRTTRPIAFARDEQPRLADLRREVWQQLRRLDDGSKAE
ncbi:YcjF family protein [Salinicola socius]|uniref:TIGR01620 family protein n=1 Tax=Salinicola socius TaxID=404433 RepID=A0A1Q8SSE5_9GAMM|nr:TIGR01620 family protein [Salinicola socius]OLO04360.1 TIGR01620 family protein [Salinicola socius]